MGGRRDQALAYSRCMRRNGVPDFPDPTSSGTIQLAVGNGLDPGSPLFQAAQKACFARQPGGGPKGSPGQGISGPEK